MKLFVVTYLLWTTQCESFLRCPSDLDSQYKGRVLTSYYALYVVQICSIVTALVFDSLITDNIEINNSFW